jgi:hypothetical protein
MVFGTALFLATLAAAQQGGPTLPQPRVNAIHPSGAKAGAVVDLRLAAGSDLDGVDRLLFSHPGISAEPVREEPGRLHPQGRAVAGAFRVRVAADVPPGVYELRAAGYFGVSNARRFVVGDQDEILEKEPNNDAAAAQEVPAGAVVNGACDAQSFDAYRIAARKGQRILADCHALRIDSRAQPVLTLLAPDGRELRRVIGTKYRDPLLDFHADQDGVYTVLVYDLLYRGGPEFAYRLGVGSLPWIDYADPCVLKPGVENAVTLYGRNLPGGTPVEGLLLDGRPVEKLGVTIKAPSEAGSAFLETPLRPSDASADLVSWRLAGSNAVRFVLGDEPLVTENEPNNAGDKALVVQPPVQVVGRFQTRGDRDWVIFEAKKGERLWIEVFSQRLGHPVDPQIVIQQVTKNDKGETTSRDLSDADDQPLPMPAMANAMEKRYRAQPEDPGTLFTAPADGTFRVLVRDLYASSQGDPRFAYRLVIRPARPDFRLVAFPLETLPADGKMNPVTCVLRRGGADRIRVVAFRREGFDGPIRIEAANLPPGVLARPALIPEGATSVDLVLQAAPDAPRYAGTLKLQGWARLGDKPVGRPAYAAEALFTVADMQKDAVVTRLTETMALSVDEHVTAAAALQVGDAPQRTCRAGKLKIPVRLAKQGEMKDFDKVSVKIAVAGLPGKPNEKPVAAKELTITGAKPEGELELDITEKAPLGKYSLHVSGDFEVAYVRAPERAKAAAEEQKRVDALAVELANELKGAQEASKKADAELAKAKAGKTDPEAVKAAEEAKAKAAESEKKAAELSKAADALRKEAADEVKKTSEAAKEKKVKVWIASLPVEMEIVAAPLVLKTAAEPLVLKAGEKADLAVEAVREFGFADEVKVELVPPKDASLKFAAPLAIAAGAAQGTASVTADKGVKPGPYEAVLRAQIKFNGKALTVDRPLAVKVEAP